MSQPEADSTPHSSASCDYRGIYRAGGIASVLMLLVILVQIVVYVIWPPPSTVEGLFALFRESWLLGLLSLDLLYIISNTLLVPMYMAFSAALRKVNFSAAVLALVLGVVRVAAYYPSNPSFEMLSLSAGYASATTEVQRNILLASGQAMLAIYKGTTFNVYYILNAIALLMFSFFMLRARVFSRATAIMGLLAGVLMAIPSTAGAIGKVFALLSLVPWFVFTALAARTFFQFGRQADGGVS